MDRITVIKKSLTTFVCGLVGLLPIFGLVPAVYALLSWGKVSRRIRDEWNPAAAYLSWGARLGFLGLIGSFLTIGFVVVLLLYRPWE